MSLELLVGETEAGERLDRAAAALLGVPRAQLQRWVQQGCVRLNGRPARPAEHVRAGDCIEVEQPEPVVSELVPEPIAVPILFEDASLVVVDKPAGLVVHPGPGHSRGTLVNALLHHCGDLAGIGGVLRPGIVHRLDRGTSGVMVVAKRDAAHAALARQFAEHSVERLYRAWVRALPGAEAGRIDQPIGRHPRDRKRMSVRTRSGREACTLWEVEQRFPAHGVARLAVRPQTGRTHQIRVHLSAHGMPLLGDPVYGRAGRRVGRRRSFSRLERPALHAARLGFTHPATGERLQFETPPPEDLRALEAQLAPATPHRSERR